MYRGYNLKFQNVAKDENYWNFYEIGNKVYDNLKSDISTTLDKYIDNENVIDGSEIQMNWFPLSQVDIFLSHSHKNKEEAIAFSGWLNYNFGLNSFIDSCLWGYADDLLEIIDKKFCFNKTRKNFDYSLRNHSTSHIHMMLTTSLSMMMDRTECLIFLNTPKSIKSYKNIDKTESPWIYYELGVSKILKKKRPNRPIILEENFSNITGALQKSLTISYTIDTTHLIELDLFKLNNWGDKWDDKFFKSDANHPLDYLYKLYPKIN